MKILVIDDEKPTLSMFKLLLNAYGYEVFVAENGEDGLLLFKQEAPEIVFTDLKMPGMDGLDVLREINQACHHEQIGRPDTAKERRTQPTDSERFHIDMGSRKNSDTVKKINETSHAPPAPQVIIITGHGDMDRALDALDLDASDFINKPVEKKALDAALKRAESRIEALNNGESDRSSLLITRGRTASTLTLGVAGRLTATPDVQQQFTACQSLENLNGIDTLTLRFDQSFSIDRQGLFILMNFMAPVRQRGIHITMKGLSYNYIQLFKMAGLHESATILQDAFDA